jgi:phenylpropionate dioxygenase-like ring-hydroxylating dioxygenase large terminal subunit
MVHVPTRGPAIARIGEQAVMPPRRSSTLNADVYRDPHRYELERERVLRTSWMIGARSSELPNTGDWVLYEGHGETVIISRQADGGVAAFHNVCQHRGARLSRGETSGCDRRFTCPWHGWVYDTTGNLVGVPERDQFDPAELDGLRSPQVAAQEWQGWVWINLAGPADAPDLMDWIGPDVAADLGRFEMTDMIVHAKLVYEIPVNYKVIVDGFNEVYHAVELHHVPKEFAVAQRNTAYHLSGPHSMMFVPRHEHTDRLEATGDHHQYTICHYVMFPNAVFNNNPRHLQVFQPIPVAVDRTRFILWELIYAPSGPDDATYDDYYAKTMDHWAVLQGVIEEDIFVFNELDGTRHSMAYKRNLFGAQEYKPQEYHATLEHVIRGGSAMDRYLDFAPQVSWGEHGAHR